MTRAFQRWNWLLLVAAAAAGYFLLSQSADILLRYKQLADQSPSLGYVYLGLVGATALTLLLAAFFVVRRLWRNSRQKRLERERGQKTAREMTAGEKKLEIERRMREAEAVVADLPPEAEERAAVAKPIADLKNKLTSQTLEIVAFGTISSGKSSLLNVLAGRDVFRTDIKGGTTVTRNEIPWANRDKVVLVDTPGLAEIEGGDHEQTARLAARSADLVLFVADGPLKDFEHRVLQQLADMEKCVLVCLNKADWFTPADRAKLVGQIVEQTRGLTPPENVVAVRSNAAARPRVRVLSDGAEREETVTLPPDVEALVQRMLAILEKDGRDLLLANVLLQSRGLAAEAKQLVRAALEKRANAVIDKYVWQAGGAAALSPFPMLDVAAGLAISSKMVFDLAQVYRQNIDLEAAGKLVGELGKNLLTILGATAVTPVLGSLIGSALKTVPGVGTLAGGALQGLTQALVTRWIGRVFSRYFQNEMKEPEGGFVALARTQWKEIAQPAQLVALFKAGLAHFKGGGNAEETEGPRGQGVEESSGRGAKRPSLLHASTPPRDHNASAQETTANPGSVGVPPAAASRAADSEKPDA